MRATAPLAAFATAALGLIVLSRPEIVISADTLLPAAFVWDVQHDIHAWTRFQYPRVPSVFPDLLVLGLTQVISGSWRLGFAVWAFVSAGWLLVGGAWLAARIARHAAGGAALGFLVLTVLLLTVAILTMGGPGDAGGYLIAYLDVFPPVAHGGPFLLTLTAAAVAGRQVEAPTLRGTALLAVLTWAAVLSDLLSVVSLVVPLTAGVAVQVLRRHLRPWNGLRLVLPVWAAGVLGWLPMLIMRRQRLPSSDLADFPRQARWFAGDLYHHPDMALVVVAFGLLLVAAARDPRRWGPMTGFWLAFAATAGLGALVTTAALYRDYWSYRYALPLLWWTVILAAALLAPLIGRPVRKLSLALAAACALAVLVWQSGGLRAADLANWTSPFTACLDRAGLRTGLAHYWEARPLVAASEWRLQVEQIDEFGVALMWGNDPFWFTHAAGDPSRHPDYRFIIMDRLNIAQVAAAYGRPDSILACGPSSIWVYDDPNRLFENFVRVSGLGRPGR